LWLQLPPEGGAFRHANANRHKENNPHEKICSITNNIFPSPGAFAKLTCPVKESGFAKGFFTVFASRAFFLAG
jgi:hypothetical protein